jgi:dTDP-4-dehydrorhamnose 3,5-epimerase
LYCHTAPHNSAAEAALNAQDPRQAIQWPITITELSARDANHPQIDAQFIGVSL